MWHHTLSLAKIDEMFGLAWRSPLSILVAYFIWVPFPLSTHGCSSMGLTAIEYLPVSQATPCSKVTIPTHRTYEQRAAMALCIIQTYNYIGGGASPHYKKFASRMKNALKKGGIFGFLSLLYFLCSLCQLDHISEDMGCFFYIWDIIGAKIVSQKVPFSWFGLIFKVFGSISSKKKNYFQICALCYLTYDFKIDK